MYKDQYNHYIYQSLPEYSEVLHKERIFGKKGRNKTQEIIRWTKEHPDYPLYGRK